MDQQIHSRLDRYTRISQEQTTEKKDGEGSAKKGSKGLTKKDKRKLQRKSRKLRKDLRLANKRIDVLTAQCKACDDKLTAIRKDNHLRDVRDGLNRKLNRLVAERRGTQHE